MRGSQENLGIKANGLGNFRQQRAHPRAGLRQGAEQPPRKAAAVDQLPIPSARARVQQPRGGGVGILMHALAGEQIVQIFGQEQHFLRGIQLSCFAQGGQLIDGIKRLLLDTCAGIQRFLIDDAADDFIHALRAAVAIAYRVAQHASLRVQQHKVHAPGVDGYAARGDSLRLRCAQAVQDFGKQPVDIPV